MEQPESNPTFCTNNCGFYGSPQFEGMCSKCYRDQLNRSYNAELADSCPSMSFVQQWNFQIDLFAFFQGYYSSNAPVQTSPNLLQDETIPSSIEMNNSDEQMKEEDHSTSSIPHVTSAPVLCEVPSTNDSSISECSSLGRKSIFRVISHHEEISFLGASPVSAEKKKRNRCTWPTCNKKLGLTGKISRNSFSSKNLSFP